MVVGVVVSASTMMVWWQVGHTYCKKAFSNLQKFFSRTVGGGGQWGNWLTQVHLKKTAIKQK